MQTIKNPYPSQSLAGQIFGYLSLNHGELVSVVHLAEGLGEGYKNVYNTVYRDNVGALHFKTENGVKCVAINHDFDMPKNNEAIERAMLKDKSPLGLHVSEIARLSNTASDEVKAFIKE